MKIKLMVALLALISATVGFFANQFILTGTTDLISPFVSLQKSSSYPLLSYSISNLRIRDYVSSKIVLEKLIAEEKQYNSYVFSYTTLGKKMTGQINIPDKITSSPAQKHPTIIMIRGYVPNEIYSTGIGTKSAADSFANNGYITVAPDFFGYGESDPEPEDSWQTRFEKPIIIIELMKSLETNGIPSRAPGSDNLKIDDVGIWAHSNGGQIALTTLEIIDKEIPTTLWAPVTAPFPYSVLYFGDELEDEGKNQRKWISMFEEKYDTFDFSLTQHLDLLQGPIQIHHGDADDAALIYWSEEFLNKVELENSRRAEILESYEAVSEATKESELSKTDKQKEIDIVLHKYKNTNHNMSPNWNTAISRDIQFFKKYLESGTL